MNNQILKTILLLLFCVNTHDGQAMQQAKKEVIYDAPEELRNIRKLTPEIRIFPPRTPKTSLLDVNSFPEISTDSSAGQSPQNGNIFKMCTIGTSSRTSFEFLTISIKGNSTPRSPELLTHGNSSNESLPSNPGSLDKRGSFKKAIQLYEECSLEQEIRDFAQQKNIFNSTFIPQEKAWSCIPFCCGVFLKN